MKAKHWPSVMGILSLLVFSVPSQGAIAGLKPDKVTVAEAKKTKSYVSDGIVVGGDWGIDTVAISGIRRATNAGFERVVIDLEGSKSGESPAVDRPPYYHVAVSPGSKRVVVTILGRPRLSLTPEKVSAAFRKSRLVTAVELMPLMEKDRWSFVLELKTAGAVEVFELVQPTRIILDLKAASAH